MEDLWIESTSRLEYQSSLISFTTLYLIWIAVCCQKTAQNTLKKDLQMTAPNTNLQDQVITIRDLKRKPLLELGKRSYEIYPALSAGLQAAKAGRQAVGHSVSNSINRPFDQLHSFLFIKTLFFLFIRTLIFRPRLNVLIFSADFRLKYCCEYS